jgi:regulatory protein
MTITGLERQKRNRRRVNVCIDGVYAFPLLEETIVQAGLRKGDQVDAATVERLKSAGESDMAKEKALLLIRRRLHSAHEIRQKLRDRDFSPEAIEDAVRRLQAAGLLNDEAFAIAYTHDLLLRRPAGRIVLERALRMKGVSLDLARSVVQHSLGGDREFELALTAARKAARHRRGGEAVNDGGRETERITRSLLRKGFSWEIVRRAMRNVFGTSIHEHEGGI